MAIDQNHRELLPNAEWAVPEKNFVSPSKCVLDHSEHFCWAMYNPSPMVSGLLDDPPPSSDCKMGQGERPLSA